MLSPGFDELYSHIGRPSIPPEKLLRALLLQVLYSVRSERQLMEQLDYNLLFRWFVGLAMDAPIWDVDGVHQEPRAAAGRRRRRQVLPGGGRPARVKALLSDEHFSVDGTLIEAWASMKSFKPKDAGDGVPPAGRRAQRRARLPRREAQQRDARLDHRSRRPAVPQRARQEAKLCHMGHLLMENRNGLVVDTRLTEASGTAERDAALDDAGPPERPAPGHAGRRQGLRCGRTSSPICAP